MIVVIDFMDLLLLSISVLLIAPAVFEVLINSIRNRKGKQFIRCKDCKWFGKIGCAVNIVDESDEPKENDYCSWAERREE